MKIKKKDRPVIIENLESFFLDDVLEQVKERNKYNKTRKKVKDGKKA